MFYCAKRLKRFQTNQNVVKWANFHGKNAFSKQANKQEKKNVANVLL